MDLKGLQWAVLALIIIGVLMSVGARIFEDVQDQFLDDDDRQRQAREVNETHTVTANVAFYVDIPEVDDIIVISNANSSGWSDLGSGNWTFDSDTGAITVTETTVVGSSLNVTYDFNIRDELYNISTESLAGITEMGEWQELLALVLVMAVLIALIVGSFYFGGSRTGF